METRRPVIGLLGAIASGKSFVARRIGVLGPGQVVDADALAHDALDEAARDGRLEAAFGPGFVLEDDRADRAALAARVFPDPGALKRLESIVHPMVLALITEAVQNHRGGEGPPVLVLDVPLLIESGLDRRCDALWFIDVPDALRRERADQRGLSAEQTRLREEAQTPLRRKRDAADAVIRNDTGQAELDAQIRDALDALGVPA